MKTFTQLRTINVNDRVEKKEGLSYLSWAWAWDEIKQHCPDVTYKVIKNSNGLPYFESEAGAIVYTEVTIDGITHEMWLPVMDGKNKAMKSTPYTYSVRDWKTKQLMEKSVDAYTMFDINKTIMRCLVKNIAMFGLALYIYADEDLPEQEPAEPMDITQLLTSIYDSLTLADLKKNFIAAYKQVTNDPIALKELEIAKDSRKAQLDLPKE